MRRKAIRFVILFDEPLEGRRSSEIGHGRSLEGRQSSQARRTKSQRGTDRATQGAHEAKQSLTSRLMDVHRARRGVKIRSKERQLSASGHENRSTSVNRASLGARNCPRCNDPPHKGAKSRSKRCIGRPKAQNDASQESSQQRFVSVFTVFYRLRAK